MKTSTIDNVNRPAADSGGVLGKPAEWWQGLRTFLTEVRNELKRVIVALAQGGLRDDARRDPRLGLLRAVPVGCRHGAQPRHPVALQALRWSGMTETATKNWYIVHTYSGFEKKVAESLAAARAGVRAPGRHRRGADPDRGRGGDARRAQGRHAEALLPRLHPRRDEHDRPRVARREEHAEGHRVRGRRREADAAHARTRSIRSSSR